MQRAINNNDFDLGLGLELDNPVTETYTDSMENNPSLSCCSSLALMKDMTTSICCIAMSTGQALAPSFSALSINLGNGLGLFFFSPFAHPHRQAAQPSNQIAQLALPAAPTPPALGN